MYWVEQSNCAEQKNQAATFKSELKFTVFSWFILKIMYLYTLFHIKTNIGVIVDCGNGKCYISG